MRRLAGVKRGSLGYSFLVMSRVDKHKTARESNVAEIVRAAELARDIGCDYFEVKAVFDDGHFIESQPAEVLTELSAQLAQLDALVTDTFDVNYSSTMTALLGDGPAEQPKDYTTCFTAELRTLVTPNGVYVCSYHRGNEDLRIGDVVKESFTDMWARSDRSIVNPSRDCRFHCARHRSNVLIDAMSTEQATDVVADYDPFI